MYAYFHGLRACCDAMSILYAFLRLFYTLQREQIVKSYFVRVFSTGSGPVSNETLKTAIFVVFCRQNLRSNEERFCMYFIEETLISDAFYTIEPPPWTLDFGFHTFSGGFLPLFVEAHLETLQK